MCMADKVESLGDKQVDQSQTSLEVLSFFLLISERGPLIVQVVAIMLNLKNHGHLQRMAKGMMVLCMENAVLPGEAGQSTADRKRSSYGSGASA